MADNLYVYVVVRDFGFAPNPFHGFCTLATCKPDIRKHAKIDDWVMGVGGRRLNATGRCVFLARISEVVSFDQYWTEARFRVKKPARNGSMVMMVGDNIYHRNSLADEWIQEDSHHSNADGSFNITNLKTDTSANRVLISNHFYYFGKSAPNINLNSIEYKNHRGYRKLSLSDKHVENFIESFQKTYKKYINIVADDPYDFDTAHKRVDQKSGKIT